MTQLHEQILTKVKRQLDDVRSNLDAVMYYTDPLPDNEFKRIREGYDKICEAIDKIY